ncbi:hypothetical protein LCGC14_3029740 [marine sediment metagenome]|uniref:Uncharacterized protein n=1 Tax=marine sediment metagenome TaxID=412755 RepID=A0A0F8ZIY7_9ZZZZ
MPDINPCEGLAPALLVSNGEAGPAELWRVQCDIPSRFRPHRGPIKSSPTEAVDAWNAANPTPAEVSE